MEVELIPIHTKRIAPGEDLVSALMKAKIASHASSPPFDSSQSCHAERRRSGAEPKTKQTRLGLAQDSAQHDTFFQPGDIIVISSKAVATSEGRVIQLSSLEVTEKAKSYAEKCGRTEAFCQAVLEETKKRNGKVVGTCPGALLTELKPWKRNASSTSRLCHPERSGAKRHVDEGSEERDSAPAFALRASAGKQHDTIGVILTANAGLDESNAPEGTTIGWPEDPVESVVRLQKELEKHMRTKESDALSPLPLVPSPQIAVVLSDSCCRPRRWGVTAYALAVAGIDPLQDQKGVKDLYGRALRITQEATADQLATAANALMGNADASVPAVIIRDHKITLSDFVGWVPGIAPEEDLFSGVL